MREIWSNSNVSTLFVLPLYNPVGFTDKNIMCTRNLHLMGLYGLDSAYMFNEDDEDHLYIMFDEKKVKSEIKLFTFDYSSLHDYWVTRPSYVESFLFTEQSKDKEELKEYIIYKMRTLLYDSDIEKLKNGEYSKLSYIGQLNFEGSYLPYKSKFMDITLVNYPYQVCKKTKSVLENLRYHIEGNEEEYEYKEYHSKLKHKDECLAIRMKSI